PTQQPGQLLHVNASIWATCLEQLDDLLACSLDIGVSRPRVLVIVDLHRVGNSAEIQLCNAPLHQLDTPADKSLDISKHHGIVHTAVEIVGDGTAAMVFLVYEAHRIKHLRGERLGEDGIGLELPAPTQHVLEHICRRIDVEVSELDCQTTILTNQE